VGEKIMPSDKTYRRLAAQLIYHAKRARDCNVLMWEAFKGRNDEYPEVVAGTGLLIDKYINCWLQIIWAAWEISEKGLETYRGVVKSEPDEPEENPIPG
jgi:hypothetical protein